MNCDWQSRRDIFFDKFFNLSILQPLNFLILRFSTLKCIIKCNTIYYITLGVKGAQVEELWSLDDEQFNELK